MASDELSEVQTVSSAMYGAIAFLGAMVADEEGDPDRLIQWKHVYGQTVLDFDRHALFKRIFDNGSYVRARRLIGEGRQSVLSDVVGITVYETSVACGGAVSEFHDTSTEAHRKVSYRLLELLAEATGKPKCEIVAELEVWASELDE